MLKLLRYSFFRYSFKKHYLIHISKLQANTPFLGAWEGYLNHIHATLNYENQEK